VVYFDALVRSGLSTCRSIRTPGRRMRSVVLIDRYSDWYIYRDCGLAGVRPAAT
jgi:hypothetical protein